MKKQLLFCLILLLLSVLICGVSFAADYELLEKGTKTVFVTINGHVDHVASSDSSIAAVIASNINYNEDSNSSSFQLHFSPSILGETTVTFYDAAGNSLGAGSVRVEHDWRVTQTPATCQSEGKSGFVCAACGAEKDMEIIPMLSHVLRDAPAEPASCNHPGFTAGKQCTVCGTYVEGHELIPPEEHEYVDVPGKLSVVNEASCAWEGQALQEEVCTKCKITHDRLVTIPKTAHKPIPMEGYPATFDSEGRTGGVICEVCHEILEPQQAVPRLSPSPEPEIIDESYINRTPEPTPNPIVTITPPPSYAPINRPTSIPSNGTSDYNDVDVLNSYEEIHGNLYSATIVWNGQEKTVQAELLACGLAYSVVRVDGLEMKIPTKDIQFGENVPSKKKLVVINALKKGSVGLYADSRTGSEKITDVLPGLICPVIEVKGKWYKIDCRGRIGYVKSSGVKVYATQEAKGFGMIKGDNNISIRMTASKKGRILCAIRPGEIFTILKRGKTWMYIELDGVAGYMMKKYIQEIK